MRITTADELLRAQDIGPCELVRGELRMLEWPRFERGRVCARLGARLGGFAESRRVGIVFMKCGFVLERRPDTVRAPDIAFVRASRAAESIPGYVEGAPDLAVEILSPDDDPAFMREKVAGWLEAGAGAVWLVDPQARSVAVHEAGREPAILGEADVLRGRGPLKGFEVEVREIFAW